MEKYYQGDINDAIEELRKGRPVQYIVGNVDFFDVNLKVDERVLIPRFETEGLVEIALAYLPSQKLKVVDVGTGSGCIAINIKKKRPYFDVTGLDISKQALEVAKENAVRNNTEIRFLEGNLLEPLSDKYDCIISNPPYISYDEEIMDVVKNNEPHLALYAPNNGLYFYDEILKHAKECLNEDYYIFFEIGYLQALAVKELALKYLKCDVEIKKDLNGFDRYIIIRPQRS